MHNLFIAIRHIKYVGMYFSFDVYMLFNNPLFLTLLFAVLCIPVVLIVFLFANKFMVKKNPLHNRELKKHYESMKVTLSGIIDAVIAVDIKGEIIFLNHIAQELTGYTERESLGKQISEIVQMVSEVTRLPADIPIESVLKDGMVLGLGKSAILISKNGTERSIASSLAPVHSKNGRIVGAVMLLRDITERRLVEKKLRQEKDFLNSIVNNAGIIIIVMNRDGTFMKFNKHAEKVTGYSEIELIGKSYADTEMPGLKQYIAQSHKLINNGVKPEPNETVIHGKDGNGIHILWNNSVIYDNDEPEIIVYMGIDITKRKKAEMRLQESYEELELVHKELAATQKELKRQLEVLKKSRADLKISEERYRLAMEGAKDGLWDWDIQTGEAYFSERWLEMLGYKAGDLEHNIYTWERLVHPDDYYRIKKAINDHLEQKTPYFECECSFRTKRGDYKWILSRGKAIWDKHGKPIRMAGSHTDITERRISEERIRYLAYFDVLTGLPNRTHFLDGISNLFEEAIKNNEMIALFFLDLDNFKKVNDTLGHAYGDELLKSIGNKLKSFISKSDRIARLGGDEFIILQTHVTDIEEVERKAKQILEIFQKPWILANHEFYITTSIGITVFPVDGQDEQVLLKNADTAMYKAKEAGKNTYQMFTKEMNNRLIKKYETESELRKVVERNELQLYYQPQFDIETSKMVGFEALLRWIHPEKGIILPMSFIPLAEETGIIVPIGEWVLSTACTQNKKWQDAGYPPLRVAVNLSARQFQQNNLVEIIADTLEKTGLDPKWLEIEITESVAMQDLDLTIKVLQQLKDMGVKISLDDFGTGYSSLNYLKQLPINTLKIDKTFVHGITESGNEEAIARSLIVMAHDMHLTVTAEGVETESQLKFLRKYKCDKVQGYLFSRPLPADEFEKRMLKR